MSGTINQNDSEGVVMYSTGACTKAIAHKLEELVYWLVGNEEIYGDDMITHIDETPLTECIKEAYCE